MDHTTPGRTAHSIRTLCVLAACLAIQGCALIGAGIGSAIPKHERVGDREDVRALRLSDGRVVEQAPPPEGTKRRTGSYAFELAAVGYAIDVTVVVVGVLATIEHSNAGWGDSFGSGGW